MQSNKAHFNIIMGDTKDEENCLSAFDYGDRDDRVEDLVNFATAKGSLSKVLLVTFSMRKNDKIILKLLTKELKVHTSSFFFFSLYTH